MTFEDAIAAHDEKRSLRVELAEKGFFGSRIHISRASVFSHPDTGDHEYFLRLHESKSETLSRLLGELEEMRAKTTSPLPKP